jgi:hypothetical protein
MVLTPVSAKLVLGTLVPAALSRSISFMPFLAAFVLLEAALDGLLASLAFLLEGVLAERMAGLSLAKPLVARDRLYGV